MFDPWRDSNSNSQPLGYKPSALAIELNSSKAISGKEVSLSSWCIASYVYHFSVYNRGVASSGPVIGILTVNFSTGTINFSPTTHFILGDSMANQIGRNFPFNKIISRASLGYCLPDHESQLTIPLKEVWLYFGNFSSWFLARPNIWNVSNNVIRSQIETECSLKKEDAVLWFLAQNINR